MDAKQGEKVVTGNKDKYCIFARELGTIQVDVGKRLERET